MPLYTYIIVHNARIYIQEKLFYTQFNLYYKDLFCLFHIIFQPQAKVKILADKIQFRLKLIL